MEAASTVPQKGMKLAHPLERNIEGVVARVRFGDTGVVLTDVVCLTAHDVVISTPSGALAPRRGETVKVWLTPERNDRRPSFHEGVVHWCRVIGGQNVIAIFMDKPTPVELIHLTTIDRRGGLRFPAAIQIQISTASETLSGQVSDYSLGGLAVHTSTRLEPGAEYQLAIPGVQEPLHVPATCHWSINTSYGFLSGCSLPDDAGVLLALGDIELADGPWELSQNQSVGYVGRTPAEAKLLAANALHNAKFDSAQTESSSTQKRPVLPLRLALPIAATGATVCGLLAQADPTLITLGAMITLASLANAPWGQRATARTRRADQRDLAAKLNAQIGAQRNKK